MNRKNGSTNGKKFSLNGQSKQMGTVFERKNKDGSISYRAQIRRKGLKSICISFGTHLDALEWLEEVEKDYVLYGIYPPVDHLLNKRCNEFWRKRK
jgi:hypothetical protein